MSAAPSLSLLVPASVFPAEGEEFPQDLLEQPIDGAASLFNCFQKIAAPRAGSFVLKGNDILFDGDLEDNCTLQMLQLSAGEDSTLQFEPRPAMSHFDWAGVMRDVSAALANEHFLGTPEELARVFTEAVREVSSVAAIGFSGDAVPLLTVKLSEDSATLSFLGIWLADAASTQEIRSTLPGQSWLDGNAVGQTNCILLDAAEVEGRGLKEALMSAALLGMVFGSTVAHAGEPAGQKSKLVSFFSRDTKPGQKLDVKSQKLVQDAPRIFPEVLNAPHSDLRVIINIGAQRAYLVKDGQIAFETPISSGRTGHGTPRGTYTITEKVRSGKYSTIYKCPLPGWMRIGELPVGMHEGQLPGYAASHGCVRMPIESALFIFDHAPTGTTVQILDSWTPPTPGAGLVAAN